MSRNIPSLRQDVERVMVENKIQRLLLDLDEKLAPFRIDHVEVDTRNFANMRTEIHVKGRSGFPQGEKGSRRGPIDR
jgi:hypothetical protein